MGEPEAWDGRAPAALILQQFLYTGRGFRSQDWECSTEQDEPPLELMSSRLHSGERARGAGIQSLAAEGSPVVVGGGEPAEARG